MLLAVLVGVERVSIATIGNMMHVGKAGLTVACKMAWIPKVTMDAIMIGCLTPC